MQVEGRLPDLVTQSPHALVVSHRFALFVLFVPFVAIPGNDHAAEFCKRLISLLVFIRVHSWFAFIVDQSTRKAAVLPESPVVFTILSKGPAPYENGQ